MSWKSPILAHYDDGQVAEATRDGNVTAAHYSNPEQEHHSLRSTVGLVDYSYYSKIQLRGEGSMDLLNRLALSNVEMLPIKKAEATFLLKEDASVLCDAYIVNHGNHYLLLTEGVEAGDLVDVLEQNAEQVEGSTEVKNATEELALIGLDGPFSWELAKEMFGMQIIGARYLDVLEVELDDQQWPLYRVGKTGEFGYWMLVSASEAAEFWSRLLEEGATYDLQPCGTEVLDLCKLENRFIDIYQEGQSAEHVLQLNTRAMIDPFKLPEEYAVTDNLLEREIEQRLVGVRSADGSALEVGATVHYGDAAIGEVANAQHSFSLDAPIAVAFIDADYAYAGLDDYVVQSNGSTVEIETVSAPFIMNRSLSVSPQEDSYFDE